MGNLILYWILKLFLIFVLAISGFVIYKNPVNRKIYSFVSFFVILFYSLIEGLRWNRGIDFCNYYDDLTNGITKDNVEPLYRIIVETGSNILPYWGMFIFYSALLIIGYLCVLKHFSKSALLALPLFFLITEAGSENLVRQFIAISFFLFGFNSYLKGKIKQMCAFFIAVPLIHFSGLFVLSVFFLLYFIKLNDIVRTPWGPIFIYVALFFLWDTANLINITPFLSSLNIDSDIIMGGYIENADRWFTEEGSLSLLNDTGKVSTASVVIDFIFNISIIYYGFMLCNKDKRFYIPYWFTYMSIFITIIGGDIELYNRFANWLYYFTPLVVGGIVTYLNMKTLEKRLLYVLFFMTYLYPLFRTIGTMPYSGCAFIWDNY